MVSGSKEINNEKLSVGHCCKVFLNFVLVCLFVCLLRRVRDGIEDNDVLSSSHHVASGDGGKEACKVSKYVI